MDPSLQEASTTVSAFASHAYEVLTNELERIVYLLKLKGIDALSETSKASSDLMMEVFEIRQDIDDATCESELLPLSIEMQTRYDDTVLSIKKDLDFNNLEGICEKV